MSEEQFLNAASHLKELVANNKVEDEDLLYLYSRYKQSTIGNCNIPKPIFTNFSGRKKWYAWKALEDVSAEKAKVEYVEKIKCIDPEWNPDLKKTRLGFGVRVSTLISENISVINEDEKDIFDWCKEGHLSKVQQNYKDDIKPDNEGRSLLHWACDRGHSEIVRFLLEKFDANIVDADLLTPLHYASSCGHLNLVKMLLDSGANSSLKDTDGETPLDCAATNEIRDYIDNFQKI